MLVNTMDGPQKTKSSRITPMVDRHIILDLASFADNHLVGNENVLADVAIFSYYGPGTYMGPVPDARSFADLGTRINDGGFVDGGVGLGVGGVDVHGEADDCYLLWV